MALISYLSILLLLLRHGYCHVLNNILYGIVDS